ncbi:hypothetical protein RND71_001005 [Anisodus tanguticus]|uniref:Uncharacterized protein n=1 Tax=Anisodus tanguticus TaxID=243964 RepID=A0AAE1T0M6_9SOLA|nr:hypothetical protein RND71_001005 [Anisodus tanguticus]
MVSFWYKSNAGSTDEFFLATNPELSGSPPRRLPPPAPISTLSPILATLSTSEPDDTEPFEELSSLSKSQSLNYTQQPELTVDDIEDFDDDDDLEEVDSPRYSRRVLNDAADLVLGLPSFATGKHAYYSSKETINSSDVDVSYNCSSNNIQFVLKLIPSFINPRQMIRLFRECRDSTHLLSKCTLLLLLRGWVEILTLRLFFFLAIGDDDLRETAYEILLAAAGASGGLIVPSKDKKKEKKSRLMRKLAEVRVKM